MVYDQGFTTRAVPADADDATLKANIAGGQHTLLQLCTAHLTGDLKWLKVGDQTELEDGLFAVMKAFRASGKPAPAPNETPIFRALMEHAASVLPEQKARSGGMRTTPPIDDRGLAMIEDEVRDDKHSLA